MRLRRLDLTRYGKFTDHAVDFGERVPGMPDLHVVYGPNEAGKSTMLSAFLDLIFGIGGQSPYNFLHPYPAMRIGGVLDFSDGSRAFARVKRAQNTLLDGNDLPITEGAIRADLGGIDRDAYRTMFSLDDETLEKGGESILASKGDLGQLLFSAGAGLADLSRTLLGVRAEADDFYRYRARGGVLADLKARLAALKTEKEEFDTIASDYARLIATRDRASAQYDAAITKRTDLQGRLDAIRSSLNALPRLMALRTVRERLAPLIELPDAPANWSDELPTLRTQEIELGVRLKTATDELHHLSAEIESLVVDGPALQLQPEFERLERADGLRSRYGTAEIDLPARRLEARATDSAIANILARLERSDEEEPHRLLLAASITGRLRELIESRSGLDAAKAAALIERTDAEDRLAEAQNRLATSATAVTTATPAAMVGLAAVYSSLRGSDHTARCRLTERSRDAEQGRLTGRLRKLAPWQGEADALLGLHCPEPGTVREWASALMARQTAVGRHADDVARLTAEAGRLRAERDAMAAKGLVDGREAAELRSRREQAWATHRRDLTAGSADAFEAVLRQDDLVASTRLGHVADLATLQQRGQALAVTEAELRQAEGRLAKAEELLQALHEKIAQAIRGISPSLDPAMNPTDLDGWLVRRVEALGTREALLVIESDLRDALADEQDGERRLRAALDAVGLAVEAGTSLASLLATAQDVLDRESEIRGLRRDVEERERELVKRRQAVAQTESRETAWTKAWDEACAGCWLGARGAIPDFSAVREILAAIAELAPAVQRKTDLAYRIEAMAKDQEAFRGAVANMASMLGLEDETADPLDLAHRLGTRIREARTALDRRATLAEAVEEAKARKVALDEALTIQTRRKDAMTAHFGVVTLAEVSGKFADVARRDELREQVRTIEREILDGLHLAAIGDAERMLDAVDRETLDAERVALEARLADQARLCEEIFAQRKDAVGAVEAIGGDDRVAEIEGRRRTTLLEIEDRAVHYLQLRAGTVATEHGLRIYRERHRSAMMARASEAFRTISRGAYTGLAAQPGKDSETLIALAAGGGSKQASELSKGTRFQLYLALRVAGYDEFVRARAPLPFIADDIMETFDDFRAEEAFRLLAEMAVTGQVVYLTHHRHLCDVARKVCPNVRIHGLPGAVTAA